MNIIDRLLSALLKQPDLFLKLYLSMSKQKVATPWTFDSLPNPPTNDPISAERETISGQELAHIERDGETWVWHVFYGTRCEGLSSTMDQALETVDEILEEQGWKLASRLI